MGGEGGGCGVGDWVVEEVAGKGNGGEVVKAYEEDPIPAMPIIRADNPKSIPLSDQESKTVRRDNNV